MDRYAQASVYDSYAKRMIVFGGFGAFAGNSNDVWMLPLTGPAVWTQVVPAGAPPQARRAAAAIFDPVRNRLIVFGGRRNPTTALNDVWALSLSGTPTWTALATAGTPPTGRVQPSAVYDPVGDRMIVFGGFDLTNDLNDAWSLSLGSSPTWTPLVPTGTPPAPRQGDEAVYDPVRSRMIVFGGRSPTGDFNDTWTLSLTSTPAWAPLAAAGTPPSVRDQGVLVYDPVRDRLVEIGGRDFASAVNNECWALPLAGSPAWTLLSPAGGPPAGRVAASAIYDPTSDRLVLYAGTDLLSVFGDTWALSLAGGTTWTRLDPGSPARFAASAILDPMRRRMLVFGGRTTPDGVTFTSFNDVWTWSLTEQALWTPLAVTGTPPPPRGECSAIYDPVRDQMIVFGGYDGVATFGDAWALTLSGTPAWKPLLPTGSPGTRDQCSAIYDPVRDRLLFFGGSDEVMLHNSVWALSLGTGPVWTQLLPTGTPPSARLQHSAIYDPVRDRMVVYGGRADTVSLGDCWALSLAGTPAWTQLAPGGTPPAGRDSHTGIYDPVRDRMVIFGGASGLTPLGDTWALSLPGTPAWTALAPTGALPWSREVHSAVYDPMRDRMLIYGGADPTTITVFDDVWSLAWSTTAAVPTAAAASDLQLAPAWPNPASQAVTIAFTLPRAGAVTVRILDVAGRCLRTLADRRMPEGPQSVRWDGRLGSGGLAPPGLYFCQVRADGTMRSTRVAIAR